MKPIIISIVIPTYKRPLSLARCLSALSKQTLDKNKYEIIIVSDGPDEISADVAKQLLEGVCNYRFLALPEKKGPAAARNYGWPLAVGELIAFTDDDCVPDANWLNCLLNAYKGEMLAAYTGSIFVPVPDKPTDFARNTANLEKAAFVTANCCITKQALLVTGGFDERFFMAWREDTDLEFKLLSNNIPVKEVKAALVVHPVREAAWGVSIKEQHKGIFNALLYKKFPALYRSKIQSAPAWNYYLIVLSFLVCLVGLIIDESLIIIPSFLVWLLLMFQFIHKRLKGTSRSFSHVMEMIITSMAIPFLSIYWQLYGAIKYRVLFF
jgi:glycosyltransferase involved in cell wall biosynthesis